MWALWSLFSAIGVSCYITAAKVYGMHSMLQGYLAFIIVAVAVGWIVPISYSKAPTFTHAFMLQQGLIAVFGVLIGTLIFKDVLQWNDIVGIILIGIGSILMF
jgi:drug/metabolite transporter (DMT)-like permease